MRIGRLLVANRGEIARRIFRTAREMGIRCVAVYVDADADAPFVRDADDSVRLPGGYLDGASIIDAAGVTGAEAIHPGYGFLSENAAFAADVASAGLVWVGPSADVIGSMGDKLAAKDAALGAGVPTLPATEDPDRAGEIGFPILVKAAAGGGGKGMRIVEAPADLDEAVAAARREAASGFGDDRVFLEHFVTRSRHVEIQILGDRHGHLVHLGERECSIQRRHQKIIEESPSPAVDQDMRNSMGEAALRLAGAIGYESAGTVEFLVDDDTRDFWFLEVNTRLQVEHPVTEMVTGIDLVREQLRVAAGESLGYGQADVGFDGHAIEARLYAEDPSAGFLPSTGELAVFEAAASPVVRVDTGVETGSVIGVEFDPMLAKVVAHAPSRTEAAEKLALALERLHVGGVTTNWDFLSSALRTPEFADGATTTDFIERVRPDTTIALDDVTLERAATAAALWVQGENREGARVLRGLPTGWRNARLPDQHVRLGHGDRVVDVHYAARRDGSFRVGAASEARVYGWSPREIDIEIDGRRSTARVTRAAETLFVQTAGGTVEFEVVPRFTVPGLELPAGGLVAPMPGAVLDVRVVVGDKVAAGETLVVLEAMKMEHRMAAPTDGVVTEIRVTEGSQVDNGAVLLVIEPVET